MAEKIRFFPLEVTYKIIDGKAVIHLYGKTIKNEHLCVLDENFEPYFYVIPKMGKEVQEKLEKIKVEKENEEAAVTKTEITNIHIFTFISGINSS